MNSGNTNWLFKESKALLSDSKRFLQKIPRKVKTIRKTMPQLLRILRTKN